MGEGDGILLGVWREWQNIHITYVGSLETDDSASGLVPAVNTRPSLKIHIFSRRQYHHVAMRSFSNVLIPTTKRREYMLVTFIE